MYVYKTVKQDFNPSDNLIILTHEFTEMINLAIDIMVENKLTSRNSISLETYDMFRKYAMPSYSYQEAINKAIPLMKTYRNRLRKKQKATMPHVERPLLATCYGFKILETNLMVHVT